MLLHLRTAAGPKLVAAFLGVVFLSSLVVYLIERRVNEGFITFFDSLWWTIVTVSTVGYGDRLPVSIGGRIAAIITIFVGMAIMGTVTGRIASFLMERQMKAENGLLDYESLRGHFIICGWKREMERALYGILDANPGLSPPEIVLINKAGKEPVNLIRSDPRLNGIKYVNGDFVEERDLIRAGIKGAARVLVLSDYLTKGDLQQIDSKTVMAVMSVKNINKKAYVCAELLDTKFEKYLRLSHCDEILLSRSFSRSILASASAGSGLSHVISALLDGTGGTSLATLDIPPGFEGRTYQELKYHFREQQQQLIGILENTGNITRRKREALREAQKNPDISALIPNLQSVKDLTANDPVINPPPDYPIKRYARAVVIGAPARQSAAEEAA
jgi:voltage-gated potassium channel